MSTSSQDLPPKDKALISQSCSRRSVAERGREHRLVEHGQIQPRAKHLQDAAPLPAEKHNLAAPSLGPKAPTAPRGLGSARVPHPIHRHTTACPFPPPGSRIHPSDTKIFHVGAWSFENDPSPSSAAPCSLGRAPVPCAGHPGMFLRARARLYLPALDSHGAGQRRFPARGRTDSQEQFPDAEGCYWWPQARSWKWFSGRSSSVLECLQPGRAGCCGHAQTSECEQKRFLFG